MHVPEDFQNQLPSNNSIGSNSPKQPFGRSLRTVTLSAMCEFRSVMMNGGFHKRRFVIRTRNTSFGARFLCLSPVSINMAQTVGPVFIDRCLNVGFHILPQTTPCSLVNRHFVIVGKPERIGPQLSGKFEELELRISALATASPTAKTNG